jgi:hypothetical protein
MYVHTCGTSVGDDDGVCSDNVDPSFTEVDPATTSVDATSSKLVVAVVSTPVDVGD